MNISSAILVNPITKGSLKKKDNFLYDQDGKICAEIFENEQRIDWISHNQYSELDNRVLREINKYNEWADTQRINAGERLNIENFEIGEEKIYKNNENLFHLNLDLNKLIKGKKVLDIGGSCIDTWRILAAGASEVHHIEVSKNSQNIGLQRIESKFGKDHEISKKLYFHTSPAEYLPFVNEYFDFVFSRSSIHHTMRKLSILEIQRILKKGSSFLFFEPIQTKLVNKSMHLVRKIRNIDRGTDDPLTNSDFDLLKVGFSELEWFPNNFVKNDFSTIMKWVSRGRYKGLSVPVIFGVK